MIHNQFTPNQLSQVGEFVQAVEAASIEWDVRIDSLDGIFLVVDKKDTNLFLDTSGDSYTVSALVSV